MDNNSFILDSSVKKYATESQSTQSKTKEIE